MKIRWDIDGVVRDLYNAVQDRFDFNITSWYWKYKGLDIYDLAKLDNYNFLINAKTTKYYKTIYNYMLSKNEVEFWSHQPKAWRKPLEKWLASHFDFKYKIKYYTPKQKYDHLQKEKNVILVDDFPFFKSYDRIILIDAIYNRKIKVPIRVKTVKQLENLLKSKNRL